MDNLIYKFINQSVRNVDTYQHNGSTWLIFTNDKKWVIELTKEKTLWYNYSFFKSIFDFFSMDVVENQHYITKWVEDVIKNGVKDVESSKYQSPEEVEDTIQNGVKETKGINGIHGMNVAIQNGVKQIEPLPAQDGNRDWGNYYHGKEDRTKPFNEYLDEAIRFGVKEVYWLPNEHKLPVDDVNPVDDVIDNGEKINGTFVGGSRQKENVEVVIDYGVKETHDDVYHHKGRIEGVIKCGKIII